MNTLTEVCVGLREGNCAKVLLGISIFKQKGSKMKTKIIMKSRIEILDQLAIKWGGKDGVESFEDYCQFYSWDAIITLVMIAMQEIELQGMKFGRVKATVKNNLLLKHQELTQWIEEEISDEKDNVVEPSHDFINILFEKVHKLNHN